ncbi:putative cytoplasmic protein [Escherichia fergusonii]|nr:putative cytoplasmic protein [Escherichia fergusonii]
MLKCGLFLSLVGAGKLVATHSAVLSPFDPVVWDRKRAEQLFDFSYRLECYTPATKRHYGYFVLPLLHRGQLVGRMDAKMHRKNGVLDVISLYLQEGVKSGAILQKGVHQAISDFARWQLANRITLGNCPRDLFADCRQGWEIDPAS